MRHYLKTLSGRDLDLAVSAALGNTLSCGDDGIVRVYLDDDIVDDMVVSHSVDPSPFHYSWDYSGPLFVRERISLNYSDPEEEGRSYAWSIVNGGEVPGIEFDDENPLNAGLRTFVAMKIAKWDTNERDFYVNFPEPPKRDLRLERLDRMATILEKWRVRAQDESLPYPVRRDLSESVLALQLDLAALHKELYPA